MLFIIEFDSLRALLKHIFCLFAKVKTISCISNIRLNPTSLSLFVAFPIRIVKFDPRRGSVLLRDGEFHEDLIAPPMKSKF